jgi:hypothetical protein
VIRLDPPREALARRFEASGDTGPIVGREQVYQRLALQILGGTPEDVARVRLLLRWVHGFVRISGAPAYVRRGTTG